MVRIAISLGSNLGDRRGHLEWAVDRLREIVSGLETSPTIETDPFDVPDSQPPYLNMAAVGETSLTPDGVVTALLGIEKLRGRERRSPKAARTIDLDLILYGDLTMVTPAVSVPHPRFRDRRFVLEPLAAVAADWVDPVTGRSVRQLLEDLDNKEKGA